MLIEWVRFDRERYNPNAFAAVRQGAREGTLLDAATDPIFIGLLLRNLRESLTVTENNLQLEFRPTSQFSDKQVRAAREHSHRSKPENPTAPRWSTMISASRCFARPKRASIPRSKSAAS